MLLPTQAATALMCARRHGGFSHGPSRVVGGLAYFKHGIELGLSLPESMPLVLTQPALVATEAEDFLAAARPPYCARPCGPGG